MRWVHFDAAGNPSDPMIIREHLAFPDALGIRSGSLPPCTENCPPLCPGDCNGSGMVTIDELTLGVNMALGLRPLSACPPLNILEDTRITVSELVDAVEKALEGCPSN